MRKSIQDQILRGGATTGFDYLRIGLAVAVLGWHSSWVSTGLVETDNALWSGPFRFLLAAIIPAFFALSGFLVSGSLERTRLHQFIILRVIRLMPALAVEIILSALVLGAAFTTLPISSYFSTRQFYTYFLNLVGYIHYYLPGVFHDNPGGGAINAQLWTIPYEMECYLALIVLSILAIWKRPLFFFLIVATTSIGFTVWVFSGNPVDPIKAPPGRLSVTCFLAASCIYLFRHRIPYSHILGAASTVASAALLQIADLTYLSAFPIAYMTVWLGLMRPPAIPFGDLSYGVYLFHYPILQTVVHVFQFINSWWLLTLFALPLTGGCAWLSWNLVEKQFLSRKKTILQMVDRAWNAFRLTFRQMIEAL